MSDQEPVNPAERDGHDEEGLANASQGITRDKSQTSQPHQQAEQNQDANKEYDPSAGKRPDQRRRNDKRGQMGG